MPTIAIFNGIIIQMFLEDHDPPMFTRSIRAVKALVRIGDGEVFRGTLPKKQATLVKGWMKLKNAELMENWHHAQRHGRCFRIAGPDD